jgi:ribonuclease R
VCAFLNGLGLPTDEITDVTPLFIQALVNQTKEKEYGEIANKVILRALQKARYLDDPLGHFGLALEDYCHFTSPIRRYPDLTIHRIIKETLHGKLNKNRLSELNDFVLDSSFRSSETEKNADEAERDVDDLFKALYMKQHIGEEFEGIISGVQNYGFYVELENTVEGLVKIDSLPADAYLYMEKSLKLKGNSHVYSIGDRVKIKVVASNVFDRKIDFVLA